MAGVGMPHELYLKLFGDMLWDAFGGPAYQVGSSARCDENKGRVWRDVDVRVILSDEEYESMGFGDPERTHSNGKWVAYCLAFSELGKRITGLPIDFQIQQATLANKEFPKKYRSALYSYPQRKLKENSQT